MFYTKIRDRSIRTIHRVPNMLVKLTKKNPKCYDEGVCPTKRSLTGLKTGPTSQLPSTKLTGRFNDFYKNWTLQHFPTPPGGVLHRHTTLPTHHKRLHCAARLSQLPPLSRRASSLPPGSGRSPVPLAGRANPATAAQASERRV